MNKHVKQRLEQIEREKSRILEFFDSFALMQTLTHGQRATLSQRLRSLLDEQEDLNRGRTWLNQETQEHVTVANIVKRALEQSHKVKVEAGDEGVFDV